MTKEEFQLFVKVCVRAGGAVSWWGVELGDPSLKKLDPKLGKLVDATITARNEMSAYAKSRLEGKS